MKTTKQKEGKPKGKKPRNIFKELLDKIPPAESRYISKQVQIAGAVAHFLQISGMKKIAFAERVGIKPSQLTHILSGEANPTLKFITRLEAEFSADIISIPLYEEPKRRVRAVPATKGGKGK